MSTPTTGPDNPFLRNMPLVAMVRPRVTRNGQVLYADETKTKRIFVRVGNWRVTPIPRNKDGTTAQVMPSSVTGNQSGACDHLFGFDKLQPF